jgi:hypothetical protein
MQGPLVTRAGRPFFLFGSVPNAPLACNTLDGPQAEPGGRRAGFALQGIWSDRRTPSTLAVGDEPPMNSRERRVQRAF